MTTDNRANEPTEAQVEAAAKALRADEGFMEEVHSALEVSWSEYIARLVLAAAQGAAPQAESDWRLDVVPEPWTNPAPVLPSSGVDEGGRRVIAWPTVDEVRETFKKSADRLAFDRMIAEVERAAAVQALEEAASATENEAPNEPHAGATFQAHANWLRARAEAYRQERGEQ